MHVQVGVVEEVDGSGKGACILVFERAFNIALPDLLRLLRRVDALVLNDSEARQLAKEDNVIVAARRIRPG